MDEVYKCTKCDWSISIERYIWRCPRCNAPIQIISDKHLEISLKDLKLGRGINGFISILPKLIRMSPISLGEGSTAIVLREVLGVKILFKLEYLNPTGSFKDRGSATTISAALSTGITRVIEDSSGNAGLSIACYASAAGISSRIYAPIDAPRGKIELMKLFGADIKLMPTRNEAARAAILDKEGIYVGHRWNPYAIEGVKIEAYELIMQQDQIPTAIIVPTASGMHILGLYKGFKELIERGDIREMPRFYAVQHEDYSPLAIKLGRKDYLKRESPQTIVNGLRLTDVPRIGEIVNVIKRSEGDVVLVNDHDVVQALKVLIHMGFVVEPTSATAYAALNKLINDGIVEKGETVVIPLTGSGLKMTKKLIDVLPK
ncbi:MAG: threonine synthase [Thermoprotei archaeon]|nr:MAG: threonine synthase [Thermoprotei archaeon]